MSAPICRRCKANSEIGLHGPGCCAPPPGPDTLCEALIPGPARPDLVLWRNRCCKPASVWTATAGYLCRACAEERARRPWNEKQRRKP